MYDLLNDALLRTVDVSGRRQGQALPQVFVALARDELISFEGLRAHQRQPWFSFLAQVGASCLARGEATQPPVDESWWREQLLALAGGEAKVWQLVVEDVSKPAFMQTPVPEGSLEDANYRDPYLTPDELDMLVTAKNHDVKVARMDAPALDQWVYALVTLQTMEGFLGRGNYGIARMNGGFASRPLVGYARSLSWGARWSRDVGALLEARRELIGSSFGYDGDGAVLLWCLPWDGEKSSGLALESLDPLFVEVCRRLRLLPGEASERLEAWRASTKGTRVAMPKELNGLTGDFWAPVALDKKGPKVLTLSQSGFNYKLMREILFGEDFERPGALELREGDSGAMYIVAECLARGQGQTDGLHQRAIPVPGKIAQRLFGSPDDVELLSRRSRAQVEDADTARSKILYPALARLFAAGRDERPDADKLGRWTRALERDVDQIFFTRLWASVDEDPDVSRERFRRELLDLARGQLEDAIQSAPLSSVRRWRGIADAESMFAASARRRFPELFEQETKEAAS